MRLATWHGRRRVRLRWGPSEDGGGLEVVVLEGVFDRLLGLLGTAVGHARATPVLLVRCSSVHTVGMRYAIDVALADAQGRVVASQACVGPGRLVGKPGTWLALERPHANGPWPREGDVLADWEGHRLEVASAHLKRFRDVPVWNRRTND